MYSYGDYCIAFFHRPRPEQRKAIHLHSQSVLPSVASLPWVIASLVRTLMKADADTKVKSKPALKLLKMK
jgi:hypothetical protein